MVAIFLAIRFSLPDSVIWPNSEVARRNRWLIQHLEKAPSNQPAIILVGSSATNYGVDPNLLEEILSDSGAPATILSFCMPGDVHHERLYMLGQFLENLGPEGRAKLQSRQVILMGEIFDAYDIDPLYRLEKEAFSERVIQFLNFPNASKAWEAVAVSPAPDHSRSILLAQHALLNAFAAGSLSEMRWPWNRKRKTPPFFPLEGSKDTFSFDQHIEMWDRPVRKPSSALPQRAVVDRHYQSLLTPYADLFGHYGLPTLEPSRRAYAISFLESRPAREIKIPPPSPTEMESLLKKDFWFDGVHPTGNGAVAVTHWLAAEIQRVLQTEGSKL